MIKKYIKRAHIYLAKYFIRSRYFQEYLLKNTDATIFNKYKCTSRAFKTMRNQLDIWLENNKNKSELMLLDVGGGDGRNLNEFLGKRKDFFKCFNLDIENSDMENTIIADITKVISDEWTEKYDLIYSYNAFEHFNEPHIAADNIAKMLKPGGLCIIHTVFSWRYHPVPNDYFRFTDDSLVYLFSIRNNLEKVYCGYDITRRRENIEGGYFGDNDIPPIDALGGFRENWSVFYIGIKK